MLERQADSFLEKRERSDPVAKVIDVWVGASNAQGRWGAAEILLPFVWLREAGCPDVPDGLTAD